MNSGHRRGAVAGRCVVRGKIVETEEIPSFAAVALAGLGWLPDTILSRSIIVRMRRRAPDEKIESFRRRTQTPLGEALHRRLAAWAEAVLQEATEARPKMPAGVEDRDADVWEALLAVADLAGGDWPNLARRAATELVNAAREIEPSLNILLLEDLRTIFEGEERLSTKDVLARLCALEDAPWNDLKGKPITDNQLARRLKQYGVKPTTVRLEHNLVAKGYAPRRFARCLAALSAPAIRRTRYKRYRRHGPNISKRCSTRETSRASSEPLRPSEDAVGLTRVTRPVTASEPRPPPEVARKWGL